MYITWPEGIVYLGIITKEFMEEYFILLENLMYVNVDAALLFQIVLDKYLINECKLKIINADSWIFFRKYGKEKLGPVISVHVD